MRDVGPALLGDVVVLPDGVNRSLRAVVDLSPPVAGIAALWVLGDLELVVARPAGADQAYAVYAPVARFVPRPGTVVATAAEGVTTYWASHLPAARAAMGEISYRLVESSGAIDPVLVFYRGPEQMTFVKARLLRGSEIEISAMRRGTPTLASHFDSGRYSAVFESPSRPSLERPAVLTRKLSPVG